MPKYFAMIKPVLNAKPEILGKTGIDATQEVTLLLWLKSPDNSYLEYDLHRFVRTPDGVKAYQFAQRLPYAKTMDVTPVMKRQASRIAELNDVAYPVFEK